MGTDYFIYTEAKIGDKWIGIDPILPHYDSNTTTSKPEYYMTYWNGSRSYFREACDKLELLGRKGRFSECSEEVKAKYPHSLEAEQNENDDGFSASYYPIFIDYNQLRRYVDFDKYDHHGMIHKDKLFEYEHGDASELWAVEHEELAGLNPQELEAYKYHEWDDDMGWNKYFKTICQKVQSRIDDFLDINYMFDDIDVRLVLVQCW